MDIAKFFDHIRRFPLAQIAASVGYPMAILRVSLNVYGALRRIVVDEGLISLPLWGTDGILAGSPHAVYETVAYLAMAVRAFQAQFPAPRHHLSIFVDDIALQVVDEGTSECLHHFTTATAWMVSELTDTLGLPIEKDKSFLLSSHDDLLRRAEKAMAAYSGAPVREVRKLGGSYSLQHRRSRPINAKQTRDRVARALSRHRRVARLAGSRTFGTLFQTGMLQEAVFGCELSLVSDAEIARLRSAAERAHGLPTMCVPHGVMLLAMSLDRDPRWHIDARVICAFASEAWHLDYRPHLDHLSVFEFARLYSLPEPPERPFLTAWADPVAALHVSMKRLGLQ
jgi:hypothetical protein